MSVRTRSKALQMSNTDSTSNKLDAVLAKMDDLLRSRDLQEEKLNSILEKLTSLESAQKKTAADVDALKDSYRSLDARIIDMDNELSLKASREELASACKKMEDLENRSKRNNIVIWGLKEGAEATHNSLEDFLRVEFFEKHMQLQNIEVMRAHRTNVNQRATEANTPTVRPIHIYLLRYSDKIQILKVAANALKEIRSWTVRFLFLMMFQRTFVKTEQSFEKTISRGLKKEVMLNLHSYLGRYRRKFCSRIETAQN